PGGDPRAPASARRGSLSGAGDSPASPHTKKERPPEGGRSLWRQERGSVAVAVAVAVAATEVGGLRLFDRRSDGEDQRVPSRRVGRNRTTQAEHLVHAAHVRGRRRREGLAVRRVPGGRTEGGAVVVLEVDRLLHGELQAAPADLLGVLALGP